MNELCYKKKKIKQIQINIKTSLKQNSNCESFLWQTHHIEANQPQPSKGHSIQGRFRRNFWVWAIYMARFLVYLFYFCSSQKRTGKKSIGPRLHVNQQAQAHNDQSFDYQNVKAERRVQILVMIMKPTHSSL